MRHGEHHDFISPRAIDKVIRVTGQDERRA
jgi:hypothetical protein